MAIFVRAPSLWNINMMNGSRAPASKLGRIIFVVLLVIFITFLASQYVGRRGRRGMSFSHPKWKSSHLWAAGDGLDADLEYGVVIDAGSSGTRVFVYVWPKHSGDPHTLLDIQPLREAGGRAVAKKIEPGLSSNSNNPNGSSEYLRPLLEFAEKAIPASKHKETPLYILATAGMRLLSKQEQENILSNLRIEIPRKCNFLFPDTHVEVISGKQEGVYQWIATNYVLDRLPHTHQHSAALNRTGKVVDVKDRQRTVGVIDMGGGSVQVAFEVNETTGIPSELLAEINLGCTEHNDQHLYKLYVVTYLGFGANVARKRYEKMLIESHVSQAKEQQQEKNASVLVPVGFIRSKPILDPCLPYKMPLHVAYDNSSLGPGKGTSTTSPAVTLHFLGTGNFSECYSKTIPLLNLTSPCLKPACSFNGYHQPHISFNHTSFYGFSEYWYSLEDVLRIASRPYRAADFIHAASQYCATNWRKLKSWYDLKLYPKADWNRFRMQCFKSAWVFTVLHKGFHFPVWVTNFHPTDLIDGQQVQWTLGALLYKTRFLPLRTVQKKNVIAVHKTHLSQLRALWKNESFLTLCIIVVVLLVLLYLSRLRLHKYMKAPASLRSIPSMSYYMVEMPATDYPMVNTYATWDSNDTGIKMK